MKTLRERIEIETAFLNGEDIEWGKFDGEWRPLLTEDNYAFYWKDLNYRIKPKPSEFWVLMVKNGDNYPSLINNERKYLEQFDGGKIIKVREVLDENI